MEGKIVSGIMVTLLLTSLLTIAFSASPTSASLPFHNVTHRYITMGGFAKIFLSLMDSPQELLDLPFTPWEMSQNITFSDPDPTTGVVNLSVPAESYRGSNYAWFDNNLGFWLRINLTMTTDGYGWLFTGSGTNPIQGDVDIITFNNNTGVYFFGADGKANTADDMPAIAGVNLLQLGADGIPGTPDDPPGTWGDGALDPIGSSVLYMPLTLKVEYSWDGMDWWLMCVHWFDVIMTTAVAYDIVIETDSALNGVHSQEVGHPWEFLHSGAVWNSTYKDPRCNVYVEYVCSWSMLEIATTLGFLDLMWEIKEHKEKGITLGDINGDGIIDIRDIGICCKAFGSYPGDPRWNSNADVNLDGIIDIYDLVRIGVNFGKGLPL